MKNHGQDTFHYCQTVYYKKKGGPSHGLAVHLDYYEENMKEICKNIKRHPLLVCLGYFN